MQTNSAWETAKKTHELDRDRDAVEASKSFLFGRPHSEGSVGPSSIANFEGGCGGGVACIAKIALKDRGIRVPVMVNKFVETMLADTVDKPNLLHIFDFSSCGPLKSNALTSVLSVLPHLTGVKLIWMPEVPLKHAQLRCNVCEFFFGLMFFLFTC